MGKKLDKISNGRIKFACWAKSVDIHTVTLTKFWIRFYLILLATLPLIAQERIPITYPFTRIPLEIEEDGVYELQAEAQSSGTFALVFRNKDGSFSPVEESYGTQAAFRFFFAQGDNPSLFFQPEEDLKDTSLTYSVGIAGEVPRLIPELQEVIQQELRRPLPQVYPFAQGFDLTYLPEMELFALWGKELVFFTLKGKESALVPPPFPQDPTMSLTLMMSPYTPTTKALMALAFYPPLEDLPGELNARVLLNGQWKVLPLPQLVPGQAPLVEWRSGEDRGPFLAMSADDRPLGQWALFRHQSYGEWERYPSLPRARDILISRWGIWQGEPWVLGKIDDQWHLFRWEEGFWRDLNIPSSPQEPRIVPLEDQLLLAYLGPSTQVWSYQGNWEVFTPPAESLRYSLDGDPYFYKEGKIYLPKTKSWVSVGDRDFWVFNGKEDQVFLQEEKQIVLAKP
jgi:hypothetical protein